MNFPVTFTETTADQSWRDVVRYVLDGERHDLTGDTTNPVPQKIIEVRGVTCVVTAEHPLVTDPRRRLNYAFAAGEPLAFLRGDNRVATYKRYIKNFDRFSDDGIFLSSSYGPEIARQLPFVVKELTENPMSRRAVMTIWRQNPDTSLKDISCLVSLQFILRNGELTVMTYQRSQDMNLGFPYDIFTYAMIGRWVAGALNYHYRLADHPVKCIGPLIHNMGSCHIYEHDEERIRYLLSRAVRNDTFWPPIGAMDPPRTHSQVECELAAVSSDATLFTTDMSPFFKRMAQEANR